MTQQNILPILREWESQLHERISLKETLSKISEYEQLLAKSRRLSWGGPQLKVEASAYAQEAANKAWTLVHDADRSRWLWVPLWITAVSEHASLQFYAQNYATAHGLFHQAEKYLPDISQEFQGINDKEVGVRGFHIPTLVAYSHTMKVSTGDYQDQLDHIAGSTYQQISKLIQSGVGHDSGFVDVLALWLRDAAERRLLRIPNDFVTFNLELAFADRREFMTTCGALIANYAYAELYLYNNTGDKQYFNLASMNFERAMEMNVDGLCGTNVGWYRPQEGIHRAYAASSFYDPMVQRRVGRVLVYRLVLAMLGGGLGLEMRDDSAELFARLWEKEKHCGYSTQQS